MRSNSLEMAQAAERSPRIRSTTQGLKPVNGKVNVGGGMETPNMTNLNPCNPNSGRPTKGIPNHVLGGMEDMDAIFAQDSIDVMMSSKLRFADVNWPQAARAAAKVMRRGGKVEMNVWCSSPAEAEALVKAFKEAGFSDVKTMGDSVGTMLFAFR